MRRIDFGVSHIFSIIVFEVSISAGTLRKNLISIPMYVKVNEKEDICDLDMEIFLMQFFSPCQTENIEY